MQIAEMPEDRADLAGLEELRIKVDIVLLVDKDRMDKVLMPGEVAGAGLDWFGSEPSTIN